MARKMRDSGVEWIGEVPEGWEVRRLRYIAMSFRKGAGITKADVIADGDIACIRYGDIYSKYKNDVAVVKCLSRTDKNLVVSPQQIFKGEILFSCTGELIEEIGKNIAYMGDEECLAGGDIIIVGHNQNPVFLSYALNSYAQTQKSHDKAKLKVVHISTEGIKDLLICLPSLPEQRRIADYLDEKCAAIDGAVDELKRGIEDCKAWKKAIIFELVTGKRRVGAFNAETRCARDEVVGLPERSEPEGPQGAARRRDAEVFFGDVKEEFKAEVQRRADALVKKYRHVEILPGPFVSVISTDCIKKARDISKGAKYNNFGIHGTGIAVAVDSLASVRELVFEKKLVTLPELVSLLDSDFAGRDDVRAAAKAAPKMGNADARADDLAKWLIDFWGHAFDGKKNDRGGIFRPGTGSAMYYIWHTRDVPASADGRLKGEPLSANYAPSLDVPVKGPVSVVRSFTEPDLGPVCNGGPLTIEIHDSAFAMPDGVEKVAHLVKFFIDRGGHQMQINTINRDTLLDAQAHPERHRHLIVRVWGWSGYFIELDKCYQDQIIKRVEL